MKTNSQLFYLDFKLMTYSLLVMFLTNCHISMNVIIVAIATLTDIGFGIWKIRRQNEPFSLSRFSEGFIKIIIYAILLYIAYCVDKYVIKSSIIGIDELFLRGSTCVFIILELRSIEAKRKSCGKTPVLEIVRSSIKIIKELKVDFKELLK